MNITPDLILPAMSAELFCSIEIEHYRVSNLAASTRKIDQRTLNRIIAAGYQKEKIL